MRASTTLQDDLLILDRRNHRLHISNQLSEISDLKSKMPDSVASLDVQGELAAVLPMRLNQDAAGDLAILKAGDAIEFYGLGLNTAWTDMRVYWLVADSSPGLRIEEAPAATGHPASESFAYTVERRDRTIYFSALRNGDDENFFGAVVTGNPVDQPLTLSNLSQVR